MASKIKAGAQLVPLSERKHTHYHCRSKLRLLEKRDYQRLFSPKLDQSDKLHSRVVNRIIHKLNPNAMEFCPSVEQYW